MVALQQKLRVAYCATGGGGAAFYIDPSAKVDGIGSPISPRNTFVPLGTLVGDQQGLQIFVKRGTTAKQQLFIEGASNFAILPYGSGALPIVDASVAIAEDSWMLDGALKAYYFPSAAEHAVFIDGTRTTRVATPDALSADNTQWFDSANARQYVHLPENASPVGHVNRRTSINCCVQIIDCQNWTIDGLEVWRADDAGIKAYCKSASINNGTIQNCIARDCGGADPAGGAGDSFLISGLSNAAKSTNVSLLNNRSYNCLNAAYELNWLDGVTVSGNHASQSGTGLELYRTCRNVTISRHRSENAAARVGFGTGTEIWIAHSDVAPGDTGGHANCRVESSIFANSQSHAIDVQAGVGHVITNNTLWQCGGKNSSIRIAKDGADNVGLSITNNIVNTGAISPYLVDVVGPLGDRLVMDYNHYWSDTLVQFYFAGTHCASFAAWQAASGQDAHGHLSDPLYADTDAGDFTLQDGSPARAAGSPLYAPSGDFTGAPYGSLPNCGAYA